EGTWIEDKKHALAVHTRRTADPEAALELLRAPLADLAKRAELAVEPGRMVIELRPPGVDKGAALTDLVTRLGAEAVLYAGDDLGDLAAYDAVERLREQGVAGFKLCSGSAEVTELARRADAVVPGPEGAVAFLEELVAAAGGCAHRPRCATGKLLPRAAAPPGKRSKRGRLRRRRRGRASVPRGLRCPGHCSGSRQAG